MIVRHRALFTVKRFLGSLLRNGGNKMVKASELRIGNLVTDEWFDSFKTFIKVESINDKGINLEITDDGNWSELAQHFITPEYEFSQLRGITLTEEILLKCGFDAIGTISKTEYFIIEVNGCDLEIDLDTQSFRLNEFRFPFDNMLHSLQNLYFALTGQELNVEPLL